MSEETKSNDASKEAVLRLAADLAEVQRQQIAERERTRQVDHDILIEIRSDVKYIRSEQSEHSDSDKETFLAIHSRLTTIESVLSEQKGAWKAAATSGGIVGGIVGFITALISILKR